MSPPSPMLFRSCLTIGLAVALAACTSNAPQPSADTPSQEQRLTDLERRIDRLEARTQVAPPYRSKEAIQAQINELEAERSKLLISYTPQHPAIRDIDRELAILGSQLKMLEEP